MQNGYQSMYQPLMPQRFAPSFPAMQQPGYFPQQAPAQRVNAVLVTSREEAVAAQIPFDNSVNAFINMAAGEVYLKLFNPQTGGANLIDCVVKPQSSAQEPAAAFAPMDMVQALANDTAGIKGEIQAMAQEIADLRGQLADLTRLRGKRPATIKEDASE